MERKQIKEIEVTLVKGQRYLDLLQNQRCSMDLIADEHLIITESWGTRVVNRYMFEEDIKEGRLKLVT
jgi:hypothetical protein